MPRLNFSMDDNYSATPMARPAPRRGAVSEWRQSSAKAPEKSKPGALIDPLFIRLALAMFVLAAVATLVATGSPIHLP
jgi:hypothetical protein